MFEQLVVQVAQRRAVGGGAARVGEPERHRLLLQGRHRLGYRVAAHLHFPGPVQVILPADGGEQVADPIHRFGRAQKQKAARLQRKVKRVHHPFLRGAVQVD